MSKRTPVVLTEAIKDEYLIQIIKAPTLWVVTYKGELFNLKQKSSPNQPFTSYKYFKSSFSNPGFASVLSNKLNKLFNCDDFNVVEMTNL